MNFKLVVISKIISIFGGNILGFAMILFLVEFTQSAALLGLMSALTAVPAIVINPFGGIIADRLPKKWLIVLFDFLKGICCLILLGLLMSGSYTFWNITALRIIMMAVTVLAGPVFVATLPQIVAEEELVKANGQFQAIGAIGLLGGSIVGGLLFGALGIYQITLLAAIMFMASSAVDLFIKIPHTKQAKKGNAIQTLKTDLSASILFLKNEKPFIFKLAVLTSIISLLFPPIFNIGLPFMVRVIFNQPPTLSFSIAALGMLSGGILAGNLKKWLDIRYLGHWIALIGAAALPLSLSVTGVAGGFWIFNFSLFAMPFLFSLLNAMFGAFIQQQVPENILGKVDSLLGTVSSLTAPLGMLAFGFFMDTVDLPILFLTMAAITWGIALLCCRVLRQQANPAILETSKTGT